MTGFSTTEQEHGFHRYMIPDFSIGQLSTSLILQHSSDQVNTDSKSWNDLVPEEIAINTATFWVKGITGDRDSVFVQATENTLFLSCTCAMASRKLCPQQVKVLFGILYRKELRAFFDERLRTALIKEAAKDYGLENDPQVEAFFDLHYHQRSVIVQPRIKQLLPARENTYSYLSRQLLPSQQSRTIPEVKGPVNPQLILVLGKHKYNDTLSIQLYHTERGRNGQLKNPLQVLNPFDLLLQTEEPAALKYYTAVARLRNDYTSGTPEAELQALKLIWKNPLYLDYYYHDKDIHENILALSTVPVSKGVQQPELIVSVTKAGSFYEITAALSTDGISAVALSTIDIRLKYFAVINDTWYLVGRMDQLNMIRFLQAHEHKLLIHTAKFEDFRKQFLERLERSTKVIYSYLKPATRQQIRERHLDKEAAWIIYLADSGNHITLTPAIKYGEIEVPVLSRKNVYTEDAQGNPFLVPRDQEAELRFLSTLLQQHDYFREQLEEGFDYFYLHRSRFIGEEWFLQAFEAWYDSGIAILGFNELQNNKLNPARAKVSVAVSSGLNWFNTVVTVKYGRQKASLKQLQKAVRNKSRYVLLDDGTMGILPSEWLTKLAAYFEAGEIKGEELHTPRINFGIIAELYEQEQMDPDLIKELEHYREKMDHFDHIAPVTVPATLKTTLRDYQQQGLNWLSFLDSFQFGGCLADDMGLGKTIQIIAFLLWQKEQAPQAPSLIVMPTSLLFNWQAEIEKYAPSLQQFTFYGADRFKDNKGLSTYDVILTTYGTVVSDIQYLKTLSFNYVILDESQAIKNPSSQRYQAVCQLRQRNRLILTGTPVENNTFDLYAQLSFACPGLLGSKQQFRDLYAIPIDKFKNDKRARELHQKINPFLLRRTKEEVVAELPEKTEIVLYCPMGEEQKKIYKEEEQKIREYINAQPEDGLMKSSMYVLKGLTRLRQICNAPALLNEEVLHHENPSVKLDTLIKELIRRSPYHKILVFSQFTSMLDLVRERLVQEHISFEYLSGQTKDRATKVRAFQEEERVRVFLISLKAGGTGLNLTHADYIYLIDPWWNPAVEQQAIDRSYRIGQQKKVIAVRLICPDTIEEKIIKLQASKKSLADGLIKGNSSTLPRFSKAELLQLLR